MPRKLLFSLWTLATLFAGGACELAQGADKAARYEALLSSGRRIEGANLTDWNVGGTGLAPKLEGQPLFDAAQPLRWLRDRAAVIGPAPVAFVETRTGDRLPGVVLSYDDGSVSPWESRGPHFVIRPEVQLTPPVPLLEQRIRVASGAVRRIVFQRRGGPPLAPGSAAFRDGRVQKFRSARFAGESATLLTEEGPRRAAFVELAELVMPANDVWDAVLDELATLLPAGQGRLLQVESVDGLVATASLERLRCHALGAPQDAPRWLHGIQPAWSFDVLWLPHPRIALRRSWGIDEFPLGRLTPAAVQVKPLVGSGSPAVRINRSVLDGPLHSGGLDFGSGFGVQAQSLLEFDLPAAAISFRAQVGLDRSVGGGGCVRARVFLGGRDRPAVYESGFLVGSASVADTGVIPVPTAPSAATRLLLEIDAAHDGRPAGADPFDIRDQADWLDPLVGLDPAKLQPELARRARRLFAPWSGWTAWTDGTPAAADQRGALDWHTSWNDLASSPGAFQVGVAAKQRPVVIRRQLNVQDDDRWLIVAASQPAPTNPPLKIEVRIDGDLVAEQPIPVRNAGQRDPTPLALPVIAYRGRVIDVEIAQSPSPPAPPNTPPAVVHWRALGLFPQLPMLHQVFDEEPDATLVPVGGEGRAQIGVGNALVGRRVLEVTPPGEFRFELPKSVAVRESPAWGEFRYLRFGLKKSGEGRFGLQLDTLEPRERPTRLDGGLGPPAWDGAVRIYQAKLVDQWLTIPHDLFASFGRLDLTGLTWTAVDGEAARFDAVYLARSPGDFEWVGKDRPAPLPDKPMLDPVVAAAVARAKTSLVVLELASGKRTLGLIVTADGDVLAPAHVVGRPQQPVQIVLADGRRVKGEARGSAREFDVALVKITERGPFAPIELDAQGPVPFERPYVACVRSLNVPPPPPSEKPSDPAAAQALAIESTPTMIRRWARGSVWVEELAESIRPGTPLIDPNGRLTGLASRKHHDRWLFATMREVAPLLPKLRGNEVFGNWPSQLAPSLGVTWKSGGANSGAEIDQAPAGSAAATAGLKSGDRIVRFDGLTIADPRDVAETLAGRDRDHEATLELAEGRSIKVRLSGSN